MGLQRKSFPYYSQDLLQDTSSPDPPKQDLFNKCEQLNFSPADFSAILNAMPVMINIVSLEDGLYLEANESFLRTYQLERKDVVGRHYSELNLGITDDIKLQLQEMIKEGTQIYNFEYTYYDAQGLLHTALLSIDYVNLSEKRCVVSVSRDITERLQTEAALRQSQEMFTTVFNASPSIVTITDYHTGQYRHVNETFIRCTGFKRQDIIGRTPLDLGLWPDDSCCRLLHQKLNKNNCIQNMEIVFRNRNGRNICGLLSVEAVKLEGHYCMLSVIQDISAIKEVENRLLNIIDFLPDATLVVDNMGKIIAWNRAAEKMTGYSATQMIDKGDREYALPFHGVRRPTLIDLVLGQCRETDLAGSEIERKGDHLLSLDFYPHMGYEGIYLRTSASLLYNTEGQRIGAIASIRDVSRSITVSRALKDSEAMYRRIVETANEAILIYNHCHRITFTNHTTSLMLGYEMEEMIGMPISALIYPDDYDLISMHISQRGKGLKNKYDCRLQHRNGSVVWVLVSAAPILDTRKQYEGTLVMMTDITERKQYELSTTKLDRLNLIGQIAIGIGHEIRNPLTTVRGFLQLFMQNQAYENDREHFSLMIEELDQANKIISNFLSLATQRRVELEPGTLNEVIESLSSLLTTEADMKQQRLILQLEECPAFMMDKKEIADLIMHLARNALEAMDPGHSLTISTTHTHEFIILKIADQGMGINQEILNKLGTPFQTTKDNSPGLGLARCCSIAARHNAAIEVDTGCQGTLFSILFPRSTTKDLLPKES